MFRLRPASVFLKPGGSAVSPESALHLAREHYQAGRVFDAEALCQQVLRERPGYAEALHLLGILKLQSGDAQTALALFTQAVSQDKNNGLCYAHAGDAAFTLGKFSDASHYYQEALRHHHANADVYHNLGLAWARQGKKEAAIVSYRQALSVDSQHASAYYNLGVAYQEIGNIQAAIECYRSALRIRPQHASSHFNLGIALHQEKARQEAQACYQTVLKLKPDHPGAWFNLARIWQEEDQLELAIEGFQNTLKLKPDYPGAHYWLGKALHDMWRLEEAQACLETGLHYYPNNAALYNLLAYVFNNLAEHAQAIACCKKALAIKPDFWQAHSNLLVMLHFDVHHDPASIFEEHLAWAKQHAANKPRFQHPDFRDPQKRLCIGYVSPNFYRGPVGYFMLPLLSAYNKEKVEIFCYYNFTIEDDVTNKLKFHSDGWRNIAGMDDVAVAELIFQDGIDILVDLSGHTADHRLLTFASKPAPIQVTWLDYFDTTGLEAMDYLISDAIHTPVDTRQQFTERLIRLPETRLCYSPPEFAPPVASLPALKNGFLTFGSFNRSSKMIEPVIGLWSRLLLEIPNARLILKGGALNDERAWPKVYARFAAHGVAADRIKLRRASAHADMLAEYQDIDIALDPFPHNGGATTCDALWMGVPVIALLGEDMISRQSAAMLSAVGIREFIAATPGDYIAIAKTWEKNLEGLTYLRAGLRSQMAASPLCDGPAFAHAMEEAYRFMWTENQ